MRPAMLITPIVLMFVAGSADAAGTDRYRLEKSPEGYVRMDMQTGAMSICREKRGELVCKAAVNERKSDQNEVERVQAELKALEKRVTSLENSLSARIEQSLPTEEDFNRTMSYMERFFRSFMGIVRDFEEEKPKPAEPGSDRT